MRLPEVKCSGPVHARPERENPSLPSSPRACRRATARSLSFAVCSLSAISPSYPARPSLTELSAIRSDGEGTLDHRARAAAGVRASLPSLRYVTYSARHLLLCSRVCFGGVWGLHGLLGLGIREQAWRSLGVDRRLRDRVHGAM